MGLGSPVLTLTHNCRICFASSLGSLPFWTSQFEFPWSRSLAAPWTLTCRTRVLHSKTPHFANGNVKAGSRDVTGTGLYVAICTLRCISIWTSATDAWYGLSISRGHAWAYTSARITAYRAPHVFPYTVFQRLKFTLFRHWWVCPGRRSKIVRLQLQCTTKRMKKQTDTIIDRYTQTDRRITGRRKYTERRREVNEMK